jgi:hypothetical protein
LHDFEEIFQVLVIEKKRNIKKKLKGICQMKKNHHHQKKKVVYDIVP